MDIIDTASSVSPEVSDFQATLAAFAIRMRHRLVFPEPREVYRQESDALSLRFDISRPTRY